MTLSSELAIGIIIGIVYTILVALVFFIAGLRIKMPKLIGTGSGGSGVNVPGKDISACHVMVYNSPSFLGLKIKRDPAQIVSARLYDPRTKEYMDAPLKWAGSGPKLERHCTIEAGKSRMVYLFAKEGLSDEYFVYTPESLDSELPDRLKKYNDRERECHLILQDDMGRKYRIDLVVRNSNQSVGVGFRMTWHIRRQLIRDAFLTLVSAFRFR